MGSSGGPVGLPGSSVGSGPSVGPGSGGGLGPGRVGNSLGGLPQSSVPLQATIEIPSRVRLAPVVPMMVVAEGPMVGVV